MKRTLCAPCRRGVKGHTCIVPAVCQCRAHRHLTPVPDEPATPITGWRHSTLAWRQHLILGPDATIVVCGHGANPAEAAQRYAAAIARLLTPAATAPAQEVPATSPPAGAVTGAVGNRQAVLPSTATGRRVTAAAPTRHRNASTAAPSRLDPSGDGGTQKGA